MLLLRMYRMGCITRSIRQCNTTFCATSVERVVSNSTSATSQYEDLNPLAPDEDNPATTHNRVTALL